jgi:hypothetical protein
MFDLDRFIAVDGEYWMVTGRRTPDFMLANPLYWHPG